jgi:hypothetical protein
MSNMIHKPLSSSLLTSLICSPPVGANVPNYRFPLPIIFGIKVLASGLLVAVIFAVVYTKGLRGFSGIAIGEIVGKTLKS